MKLTRWACVEFGLFIAIFLGALDSIAKKTDGITCLLSILCGFVFAFALFDCIKKDAK